MPAILPRIKAAFDLEYDELLSLLGIQTYSGCSERYNFARDLILTGKLCWKRALGVQRNKLVDKNGKLLDRGMGEVVCAVLEI